MQKGRARPQDIASRIAVDEEEIAADFNEDECGIPPRV
jgi:hypothetical protein